jgi:DNA-binding beta-propeller fold protein YncE
LAFVHTLDLSMGWAYCLELPDPFGTGPAEAHTVAVTPDGRRLVVADLSSGHLAVADTDTLSVRYVLDVPTGTGTAYAVAPAAGERLYLGVGSHVTVVDLGLLNTVDRWTVQGPVRGLAVSADGARLLVGYRGAVGWYDIVDGRPLGAVPVAGLTELRRAI